MFAVVQAARAAEAERKRAESESASIVAPEAVRVSAGAVVSTSAAAAAESGSDSDIDEDHAEYKQLANELDQMESPPMSPQPMEAQNASAALASWPAASPSASQPLPQLPPSTLISFADIQTALTYYMERALLVDEVTELRLLLHTHELSEGVTLELLTEILNTIKDAAAANHRDEQEDEAPSSGVNPVAVFAQALRNQSSSSSFASPQQPTPSRANGGLSDDSLGINSTGSAPSLLSSASSTSLAAALQRAQKENQRLSHQFSLLRDHNARTEAQLAEASEEQQALVNECKKLRDVKEDLAAELQRAKAMSAEAAAKAQSASIAAAQSHAELQALRKSHGVVQHRAEIARHASTKYETQLTHARKNSINQIEAAREAATREAANAQARILAENETLKAQLADLEAQFAAYQSEQTALAERAAEGSDSPDRDRFRNGQGDYDRGSAFSPDFARVRRIGATASPSHPAATDAAADAAASASPASAAALFEYLRSIQAKSQSKHARSGGSGGSGGSNGSRHSSSHSGADLSGLLSPLGEEEHEPEPDEPAAEQLSSIDQQQLQHDDEVARISGHSSHAQQSTHAIAVALVTADTQTDLSMLRGDPAAVAASAEIDALKQSMAALRSEQERWDHDRVALEKQLAAAQAAAATAAVAAASSALAVPAASPGGGGSHTRSLSSSAAASPAGPTHSPVMRNKSRGKQQKQQAHGATPTTDASVPASATAVPQSASDSSAPFPSPLPASAASPRPTAPTRRPLPRSLVDPAVFLAATIQSAPVSAAPSQPSSGRGSPSMSSAHRGLPPTGLATEVTPPKTRHSTLALNGITVTPPQSARQHTPPALANLSSQAAYELGFERGLHAQTAAAAATAAATSAIKQPPPPQPSGGKGSRSRAAQSTAATAAASARLLMTPTTAAALARDLGHQPLSPLSQLKSKILQPPSRSHRRSRSSNAALSESASAASTAAAAASPFASPATSSAVTKDLFASDPDYATAAAASDDVMLSSAVIVCADSDAAAFEQDVAFALAVTGAATEAAAAPAADSSSTPVAAAAAAPVRVKSKGVNKKARAGKSAAAASSSSLDLPADDTVVDSAAEFSPLTPSATDAAEAADDAPGWAPAADWPVHSAASVPVSHGKKKKSAAGAAAAPASAAAAPAAVKSKKIAASSASRSSAAPAVSARLAADLRAIAAVTRLDSKLLEGAPQLQPALYHAAAPILQCSIL